jgi:hypothetical protein
MPTTPLGTVVTRACARYLLLFGVGLSPIPWVLNGEIYPLPQRALCIRPARLSHPAAPIAPTVPADTIPATSANALPTLPRAVLAAERR